MKIEQKVLERIPRYKIKAVHLAALSSELAISESQVKAVIKRLRLEGAAIISDKNGYWIAENEQERKDFVEVMKKQGLSRVKVAAALNQNIDK